MREGRRRAGLERMWEREKGKPEKKGAGLHSVHTHPPLSLQSGVGTQKDSKYSSMSSNVSVCA